MTRLSAILAACLLVCSQTRAAVWKDIPRMEGGEILSLAISPSTPGTLYAGTAVGLFRSQDAGETWTRASMIGLGSYRSFEALAVSPLSPATLYAGISDPDSHESGGLVKSTDWGDSWDHIGFNVPGVRTILLNPRSPQQLFVATYFNISFSPDGGRTWETRSAGISTPSSIAALANDPFSVSTVYAGGLDGVFKTADSGKSWHPMNDGLDIDDHFVESLVIDPQHAGTLYVSTTRGVFKSTDGAGSWVKLTRGLPGPETYPSFVLDIDAATRPSVLYAGSWNQGLYVSRDEGATWQRSSSYGPAGSTGVLVLRTVPNQPGELYSGYRFGLGMSLNYGSTWRSVNSGLRAAGYFSVSVDPTDADRVYASAGYRGFFASTDGGKSWRRFDSGGGGPVGKDIQFLKSGSMMSLDPWIERSLDGGRSWKSLLSWEWGGAEMPVAFAFCRSDADVLYASDYDFEDGAEFLGILRSGDGGKSWISRYPDNLSSARALLADPGDPRVLYAGGSDGFSVSTDGGDSFVASNEGLGHRRVGALWMDPNKPGHFFAATYSQSAGPPTGLFRTVDSGKSWKWANGGIPDDASVIVVTFDPLDRRVVYAGTDGSGVFRSVDGGSTWVSLTADLKDRHVASIAVSPLPRRTLYLRTNAGSLFTRTLLE